MPRPSFPNCCYGELGLTQSLPWIFLPCPSQRGEAHPCPFRGRHGCACWGTGGSGWIPQGKNPGGHRPRFHRRVVQGNAISFHELTSKIAIGAHGSASRMETGLAPGGVSYVWQTKGLREPLFGSVAMIRLTGGFPGSVANKGVRPEAPRCCALGMARTETRMGGRAVGKKDPSTRCACSG